MLVASWQPPVSSACPGRTLQGDEGILCGTEIAAVVCSISESLGKIRWSSKLCQSKAGNLVVGPHVGWCLTATLAPSPKGSRASEPEGVAVPP